MSNVNKLIGFHKVEWDPVLFLYRLWVRDWTEQYLKSDLNLIDSLQCTVSTQFKKISLNYHRYWKSCFG